MQLNVLITQNVFIIRLLNYAILNTSKKECIMCINVCIHYVMIMDQAMLTRFTNQRFVRYFSTR
jgi:hypothetical protein